MEPLTPRDKKILDLVLRGGLKHSEIAARCGVSVPTVSYCTRKPAGRQYLEKRRKTLAKATEIPTADLREASEFATVFAFKTLVRIMVEAPSDDIKLRACEAVMSSSAEMCSILARLPSMTDEEFAFMRELVSVDFGIDEKVTFAEALFRLDQRVRSANDETAST